MNRIIESTSDLNFFWVVNDKRKKHLFVTLESSLGLRSIDSCGIKGTTMIGFANKKDLLNRYYDIKHFYFAETNKLYSVEKDFDEFRRDYLITKLAGIKQ